MLLNDKTYSKVARDLFSFPVLYRSILVVYWDIFLPFYFSCAVGGHPPPSPRVPSSPGDPAERKEEEEGRHLYFLSVEIPYFFVAFARC